MRALLTTLLFVLTGLAWGHDSNLNGVRIVARPSDTLVAVSGHLSALERQEGRAVSEADLADIVARRLKLAQNGNPVVLRICHTSIDRTADQFSWQATTPLPAPSLRVLQPLFPEDEVSKTVVSYFENGQERDGYTLSGSPAPAGFVVWGLQHILSGPDHILFVVGLVIVGGRLREIVKTATAFTLAHSITLGCAVARWVHVRPEIVEPLIALSIVAVAVEGLSGKAPMRSHHALVAFAFGLIHGLGFAGALQEVSLSGSSLGWALANFNGGVELGQLAVILITLPLLTLIPKWTPVRPRQIQSTGCLLLGAVGIFWFTTRLMLPG